MFRDMFKQDKAEHSVDSRRDFLKKFSGVITAGGVAAATVKAQMNPLIVESLKKISRELERVKQLGQHQHEKLDQQVQRLDKRTQLVLRILLIYLGIQAVGYLLALFGAGAGVSGAIASVATRSNDCLQCSNIWGTITLAAATGAKVATKAMV